MQDGNLYDESSADARQAIWIQLQRPFWNVSQRNKRQVEDAAVRMVSCPQTLCTTGEQGMNITLLLQALSDILSERYGEEVKVDLRD